MIVNLTLMGCAIGRQMTVIPQVSPGSETQAPHLRLVLDHPEIIHPDQVKVKIYHKFIFIRPS